MDDQIKFENKDSGKEGVLKSKTKVVKNLLTKTHYTMNKWPKLQGFRPILSGK